MRLEWSLLCVTVSVQMEHGSDWTRREHEPLPWEEIEGAEPLCPCAARRSLVHGATGIHPSAYWTISTLDEVSRRYLQTHFQTLTPKGKNEIDTTESPKDRVII